MDEESDPSEELDAIKRDVYQALRSHGISNILEAIGVLSLLQASLAEQFNLQPEPDNGTRLAS